MMTAASFVHLPLFITNSCFLNTQDHCANGSLQVTLELPAPTVRGRRQMNTGGVVPPSQRRSAQWIVCLAVGTSSVAFFLSRAMGCAYPAPLTEAVWVDSHALLLLPYTRTATRIGGGKEPRTLVGIPERVVFGYRCERATSHSQSIIFLPRRAVISPRLTKEPLAVTRLLPLLIGIFKM